MPVRRYHKKTRTGCVECKKRRIKCDEVKPKCSPCTKRGDSCSFNECSLVIIPSGPKGATSSQIPTNFQAQKIINCPELLAERRLAARYVLKDDQHDMLRLMHHYALSTCESISDSPQHIIYWKEMAPAIAFEHDFLLSALLAVTSLHLALLHPSKGHNDAASSYHEAALAQFNSRISTVTPANVEAVFLFSCLVPLYLFGIHNTFPATRRAIEEITEIFVLVRGTSIIVQSGFQWLDHEAIGSILPRPSKNAAPLPPEIEAALSSLATLNRATHSNPESSSRLEMFQQVLSMLRYSFILAKEAPKSKMPVITFPIMIPERFMEDLSSSNEFALTVLGHYAVLLFWLRDHIWLAGWGKEIVDAVSEVVGEEWKECMKWAMKQVGQHSDHELVSE